MCLQVKRKRYMYLSMCSYCNVVSRYSSSVKKHLQTNHSQESVKKALKVIVPIRVEERCFRSIRRSLDKKKNTRSQRKENVQSSNIPISAKSNEITETFAYKENVPKQKSVLCAVCKKTYEGLVSYFNHLSEKDHKNGKISFTCTVCSRPFNSINDFVKHNKEHTEISDLSIRVLDRTKRSVNTSQQCPYCVSLFKTIEQMYLHIGDKHFRYLEITKVQSIKADENMEEKQEETVLLSYKCKYCAEPFHALGNFLQHILDKHPDHNIGTARLTRKRTQPKWLIDGSYEKSIKRPKRMTTDQADAKSGKEKQLSNLQVEQGKRTKGSGSIHGKHLSVNDKGQKIPNSARDLSPKVTLKRLTRTPNTSDGSHKVQTLAQTQSVEMSANGKNTSPVRIDNENKKIGSSTSNMYHEDLKIDIENIKIESKDESQLKDPEYVHEDEVYHGWTDAKTKLLRKYLINTGAIKTLNETVTQPEHISKNDESLIVESFGEDMTGDSDDDYVPEQDSEASENNFEMSQDTNKQTSIGVHTCLYCRYTAYAHKNSLRRHIKDKHPHMLAMFINGNKTQNRCEKQNDSELIADKTDKENNLEIQHVQEKVSLTINKNIHRGETSENVENARTSSLRRDTSTEHPDIKSPIIEKNDNSPFKEAKKPSAETETDVCKFKCPFCAFYLFHREYVISHIQKEHPEVHQFTASDVLKETVSLVQNDIKREMFQCPKCRFSSKWKTLLLKHHRRVHYAESPLEKVQCTLPTSWIEENLASAKLNCPICQIVVEGKRNLEAHVAQHMGGKKCIIEIRNTLSEPKSRKRPCKKLITFLCPFCLLTFARKESLKAHFSVHIDNTASRKVSYIKCVLVKCDPDKADTKIVLPENDNVDRSKDLPVLNGMEKDDKSTSTSLNHSNLTSMASGTYICPLCDNFKTLSKVQAVEHMEINHAERLPEVELIYIFEAFVDSNGASGDDNVSLRCVACNFSSNNLTDTLRHGWSHTFHNENRIGSDHNVSNTVSGRSAAQRKAGRVTENKKAEPLFKTVSILNSDSECSEEIYKCWQCDPIYTFRSRRGGKGHALSKHVDPVIGEVNDVLNQMIDVLDVKSLKGYMCLQCEEQSASETDLVIHFKDMHPDKVTELEEQMRSWQSQNGALTDCEICYERCQDRLGLHKHLLLHKNRHKLHCRTCGIRFEKNEDLATHCRDVHSKSSKMCNVCGKIFVHHIEFYRHMKDHTCIYRVRQLCQYCGTDVLQTGFQKHLLRFHAMCITCECEICTSQIAPADSKVIMCNSCNIVFCSKFMLNVHNKKMHLKEEMPVTKDQKLHMCVHCGTNFENTLQQHSHKCQKNHQANEQQSGLLDTNQLKVSESENCVEENISADIRADVIRDSILEYNGNQDLPYSCRICHKSFKVKKYLYAHVRRTHSADESKRFRCKICKMGFTSISSLKRHCRTHIGLRPHQCNICKRNYKTSSHLKEHMRLHTEKQEPQASCRYCGCKFNQNRALMDHVIYHSKLRPFKCPFCQKDFTTSAILKQHMDRYMDDKNIAKEGHVCHYCNKEFPNLHYLIKHFQRHNPKDPFNCIVCQRRFGSFRQLYKHKDRNNHFTVQEIEEARKDTETPGRRFKGMHERKELTRLCSHAVKKETYVTTSTSAKSFDLQEQSSPEQVFENQDYVEIEIPNCADDSKDESAKIAMTLFESNVLQSMFEINKPGNESEVENNEEIQNYGQQNQSEYIVEGLSENDSAVPLLTIAESGKESKNRMQYTHTGSGMESANELAYAVAQNAQHEGAGETQSFEMPDGSLVHVIVLKPKKE